MRKSLVEKMRNAEILRFIDQHDEWGFFVEPCEYGHYGCSNTYLGPCFDEACHQECYLMKSSED